MSNCKKELEKKEIIVDVVDDFSSKTRYGIINKLKGTHHVSPKITFYYKECAIDIYEIENYFLMHCPCRWWNFVLLKEQKYSSYEKMEEECIGYLKLMGIEKHEQLSLFQDKDIIQVEKLENYYNEQHSPDEEIYL